MKARPSSPNTMTASRRKSAGHPNVSLPAQRPIPKEWGWHYSVLHNLRERLLKDRGDQLEEATAPVEFHGTHLADTGSDEFDHECALGLLAQEQDMLIEVDAAIQRIHDGKYGLCEETGKVIPAARLRAVPWTRYAKDVEERLEQQSFGETGLPGQAVAAFHSLPPSRRGRTEELDLGDDEETEDAALNNDEPPVLDHVPIPPSRREDVIHALEDTAEIGMDGQTGAVFLEEPIPENEL